MNIPKYRSGDLIGIDGKLYGIILNIDYYNGKVFDYTIFWTHKKKRAIQSQWLIETYYEEFWKRKV